MDEKIVKDSQGLAKELVNGVKEFEELKVIDLNGRPYYSIIYLENGNEFEGYSSYNLKVISEYLKRHFGFAQPETHDKRTEKHACDCISRQAAIDEVINLWADKPFGNPALVEIKDCIEKLPSAQPYTDEEIQKMQDIEQAQLYKAYEMGKADALRWIPCSVRLPDAECGESDIVLATCGYMNVENTSVRWIKTLYFNGGNWCYPTGETYEQKVYAWMPLPEPYKGG